MLRQLPRSMLFPYTTLFRSDSVAGAAVGAGDDRHRLSASSGCLGGGPTTLATRHLGSHPKPPEEAEDRKSTRLNSSHVEISYAVFCLKKKRVRKSIAKVNTE